MVGRCPPPLGGTVTLSPTHAFNRPLNASAGNELHALWQESAVVPQRYAFHIGGSRQANRNLNGHPGHPISERQYRSRAHRASIQEPRRRERAFKTHQQHVAVSRGACFRPSHRYWRLESNAPPDERRDTWVRRHHHLRYRRDSLASFSKGMGSGGFGKEEVARRANRDTKGQEIRAMIWDSVAVVEATQLIRER